MVPTVKDGLDPRAFGQRKANRGKQQRAETEEKDSSFFFAITMTLLTYQSVRLNYL
jgi:hypothetical protein